MSPRVYERRFDWNEAIRRYEAGESMASIARDVGVTTQAVRRAVDAEYRARDAVRSASFQRSGTCPDCGAQTTRLPGGRSARCNPCRGMSQATSVRPDELHCYGCGQWKPDRAFPWSKENAARRHRRGRCTACDTIAKRDYRRRNPGRG